MTQRKTDRRIRATEITASLFSRDQANYLGTIERVTWIEDWTQIRGLTTGPWQDISCSIQLVGQLDDQLSRTLGLLDHEFYVTLDRDGSEFSGNVLMRRKEDSVALQVQGGFEQERGAARGG